MAIYGHRILAAKTPYTVRCKYGRKTPVWFPAKYGMCTTRIWLYTTVKTPYLRHIQPYTVTVFNQPGIVVETRTEK
jgi:hypothetical protein